jgi:hypothetical protein
MTEPDYAAFIPALEDLQADHAKQGIKIQALIDVARAQAAGKRTFPGETNDVSLYWVTGNPGVGRLTRRGKSVVEGMVLASVPDSEIHKRTKVSLQSVGDYRRKLMPRKRRAPYIE